MILAHCRNTLTPSLFPQKAQALRLWDGGTRMSLLNPAADTFVWDKLDAHLAASEAAGLKSIFTFGCTPAYAAITTGVTAPGIWPDNPKGNCPMDPSALAEFTCALMEHCGNRLWALETQNEPNAPNFWGSGIAQCGIQHYVIATTAKKKNPSILITTPSPCLASRCLYPTADAWLAAWLPMGLPFDVVAFHGYVTPNLPPGPQIAATIQNMHKVMAQFGVQDKPLWDTEFSPTAQAVFANDDAKRLWLLDSYMARQVNGLDLCNWHQWDNQTNGCVDRATGALTPFGQAFMDYTAVVK